MSHVLKRDLGVGRTIAVSGSGKAAAWPAAPCKRPDAPRVLLVDDDASVRMVCAVNLGLLGIEVLEAEDGARGFALARRECPNLVVLDVSMPGLDGFEVAELLRGHRRTRRIPFMFLSGEVGNEARARDLGAFAYMTKPFDPIALAALIAETLRSSRAEAVRA